jgi:hypothetical protein
MSLLIDATYSAEDNKLRLYASERLEPELFARFKENGFKWAPKQELFVAGKWTPQREDFCLELAGEITAEQSTMVERAEAKAGRLDDLACKRSMQANSFYEAANKLSERFAYGQPILVGHHSERKARKDKERMENCMDKSVKAAKAVDYWNWKAVGVERHANRKSDPKVRARRIKTLLADLRDKQRSINHFNICFNLWTDISNESENSGFKKKVEFYAGTRLDTGYTAPMNAWSRLNSGEVTHEALVIECLAFYTKLLEGDYYARWVQHILNRLAFETMELGEVPRFTGELTAVIIQAFARAHGAHKPKATKFGKGWNLSSLAPLPLHIAEGEKAFFKGSQLIDLMHSCGYEVPMVTRKTTAKNGKTAPLINPTVEDVEKLQALWNKRKQAQCEAKSYESKTAFYRAVSQSIYSANSKGDYSLFNTIAIDANGERVRKIWKGHARVDSGVAVCRIRVQFADAFSKADSVILIEDKPSKPLPLDWDLL